MKSTSPPMAAALIFAAAAALLVAGALGLPLGLRPRPATLNAAMLLCLAAYAAMLARLSGKPLRAVSAPLLILAALLPVADSVGGFVVPAAAGLAWIRSGVCFPGPLGRRFAAEALTAGAGLFLCAALRPPGPAGWALALWMFFLVQALYFAFVDTAPGSGTEPAGQEPRAALRRRAQALLREQKLARAFEALQLSSRRGSDR